MNFEIYFNNNPKNGTDVNIRQYYFDKGEIFYFERGNVRSRFIARERKKEKGEGGLNFILTRKISQSAISRLRVLATEIKILSLFIFSMCARAPIDRNTTRGLVINTAGRVKKYRRRNERRYAEIEMLRFRGASALC